MYPGTVHWWLRRRWEADWRPHAGCGTGGRRHFGSEHRSRWSEWHAAHDDGPDAGASAFGVRRPLRFLAFKLGLDERQVGELARILNALKTERAQGEVDRRRASAGLADAMASPSFDAQAVNDAATARVRSAERLRDAVTTALRELHALLDPEQRAQLAYLIRTGTLHI